ncbi:CGI-20 protein-like protein [Leptotrombidium deliense]|uniref:CGI-20 protein-like protein n=1 Tax=Leptotrombidium deliense TaxID=299467 RepID=A0A443RYV5_9ACAR|nr:CGI-20 protein-like protein [Leptotrombidium deliense]
MATTKSDKIVLKLKRLIDSGEYYEAHQLYRTLFFRYTNGKRYEELQELLFAGATELLSKNQFNSGADLASLYIDSVNQDPQMKQRLQDDKVCIQLSERMGELLHKIPSKSTERIDFMMSALKMKSDVFPLPLIHYQFALILWREKNFSDSRYHFLYSPESCGEDCALMLIEYHVTAGYHSEVDLFIAQFILQLLCSKQTKRKITESNAAGCSYSTKINGCKSRQETYANIALRCFTTKHPDIQRNNPPFLLPLLNFLWFLLLAIDSGKANTFKVLCDLYSPLLNRDPTYKEYLSKIGELYFGMQSPTGGQMGGFLGNLLQSLFEDDSEENSDQGNNAESLPVAPRQQVDDDLD